MKKTYADHNLSITLTILVGVFPIFALWQSNIGEFPSRFLMYVLFFGMAVNLLVYMVWFVIFKDPLKSSMLTIAAAVYLFTFGHIYNLIGNHVLFGIELGFIKQFIVWTVAFLLLCTLLMRSKRYDRTIIIGLNISLLALSIYNIYPILSYEVQLKKQVNIAEASDSSIQADSVILPDIYYIVLDSYANEEVLSSIIGYDNSDF